MLGAPIKQVQPMNNFNIIHQTTSDAVPGIAAQQHTQRQNAGGGGVNVPNHNAFTQPAPYHPITDIYQPRSQTYSASSLEHTHEMQKYPHFYPHHFAQLRNTQGSYQNQPFVPEQLGYQRHPPYFDQYSSHQPGPFQQQFPSSGQNNLVNMQHPSNFHPNSSGFDPHRTSHQSPIQRFSILKCYSLSAFWLCIIKI